MTSYPSIYNIGHRAVADLLKVPVNVEEKVDGSQFSFGLSKEGELHVRSKGAVMHVDAPEKMFTLGVETARRLAPDLVPGWTYRGEFLAKAKHNSLAYNRAPNYNVIIFDINTGEESYLPYENKHAEASRIGLECVPLLFSGMVEDVGTFRSFLDKESILGGQKIEGVVVKPSDYNLLGQDKKVLMGKFVSEAFKEIHSHAWKESNPTSRDILTKIAVAYTTAARWSKSVQHLRERGQIDDSPKDIGKIILEIKEDVRRECEQEIRDLLWNWAWPHISRQVTNGSPEWYKEQLLKLQFDRDAAA
jgi:hypothetical protein